MEVPTGTSLCHRSGFAGNGSRDAHCSLVKRLILFLAKMKFAGKSQILRFIYQKLEVKETVVFLLVVVVRLGVIGSRKRVDRNHFREDFYSKKSSRSQLVIGKRRPEIKLKGTTSERPRAKVRHDA